MTMATPVASRRPERERYDENLSLKLCCWVSLSILMVTCSFACSIFSVNVCFTSPLKWKFSPFGAKEPYLVNSAHPEIFL